MSHPLEEYFSYQGTGSEGIDIEPNKSHPLSDYFTDKQDISLQERKDPEKGFYKKYVEEPAQILGGNIVAGARAIPRTGFEFLKSIVSATGGDLSKLEEAQESAPEWLKKFGSAAFPTFEEQRERHMQEGAPQEDTFLKKWLGKFGRFIGEAPAFGGLGGVKGAAALAGAAGGLQVAEDEDFGPLGQLASGALGALAPAAITGAAKGVSKAIASPKEALAKGAAKLTSSDKLNLRKQIIEDARESGVQLDIGSLTDSKILKGLQTSLAQSKLSGAALDDLKQSLMNDIRQQYKKIGSELGEARFETRHEAGSIVQNALKEIRDKDLSVARDLYNSARKRGGEFQVFPGKVADVVNKLEEKLAPGSIKSSEQQAVLNTINKLRSDVLTPEGSIRSASINELINNKIALNDIIDYEVQGGAKQLLKEAVKAIDEVISSHGKQDPLFAKEWNLANKKFSDHAKTFRNKNVNSFLMSQDPAQILSKMNTAQGIKDFRKSLGNSAEGEKLFNDLSRFKLDELIGKHLEDGVAQQAKFGTFSNALNKGKNAEILKELLGQQNYKRLEKLSKTAGVLAESANKFLNTSQSGTSVIDAGIVSKIMTDLMQLWYGNPWPAARSIGMLATTRYLSKLIADPKFLKLVEEAVLASKSNKKPLFERALSSLADMGKIALREVSHLREDDGSLEQPR